MIRLGGFLVLIWASSLQARDQERPFFLYLSHKAVHAMFEPAERHAEQYPDAKIALGAPSIAADGDVPM